MRATAATQFAPVQLAETNPVDRKLVIETEDVQPLEKPIKIAPPRPIAAPQSPDLLSAVTDDTSQQQATVWRACPSSDKRKTTAQISTMCPVTK